MRHLARLFELPSSGRLRALEGVRGLAVLLVFCVHYDSLFGHYLPPGSAARALSQALGTIGNVGVDLFFVLSGYLLYGALRRRASGYGRFLWRRVERLYPTFLTTLALYLILGAKLAESPMQSSIYLAQNVALLPGIFPIRPIIGVAWSLSYEMFFYLVVPFVVLVLRGRSERGRIGALVALAVAFALPWHAHVRVVLFVAGMLVYELGDRLPRPERLVVLAFLVSLALYWWLDGFVIVRYLVLFVPFGWLVACALAPGRLNRAFSWTPLRWLGNISYSYYLIHGLALHATALALARVVAPFPLLYALALPLGVLATLVAATLLFALVERPLSLEPGRIGALLRWRPLSDGAARPGPLLQALTAASIASSANEPTTMSALEESGAPSGA